MISSKSHREQGAGWGGGKKGLERREEGASGKTESKRGGEGGRSGGE